MTENIMSEFWSWWVIAIVAINIIGCWALLYWTRRIKSTSGEDNETTGHVYDGIEEYNNPLPRWWLNMFYITLVFGVGYLILYPGLGNFAGYLGWTAQNQHAEEVEICKRSIGYKRRCLYPEGVSHWQSSCDFKPVKLVLVFKFIIERLILQNVSLSVNSYFKIHPVFQVLKLCKQISLTEICLNQCASFYLVIFKHIIEPIGLLNEFCYVLL